MSRWTSRIKEHRVWKDMQSLGPSIDQAVGLDDIDPSALEDLERLRTVLAFSGKRLGGADPLTAYPSALEPIATSFETAKTEIDAFVTDRDVAYLASANTAADTALAHLTQVPTLATPQELIGMIDAIASHRAAVEEQERSSSTARKVANSEVQELAAALSAFTSQTQSTLAELKSQIEAEKQKISVQASEQQKAFADAQQARNNTYNETVLKIQETLAKTISDQQGQFSGAQENRNLEFTRAQTDSQKRFAGVA